MSELLPAIILFALTIAWFALPLIPTMIEMRKRTQAKPLAVDRDNDGEVRHFAKRFKSYLESNFPQTSLREYIDRGEELDGSFGDGTPYQVLGRETDAFVNAARSSGSVHALTVFSAPIALPDRLKFTHGIYAAQNIDCGSETIIRSLYGERDVRLREKTVILRWIHVDSELIVAEDCALYGRASAEQGMRIGARVKFQRLHGRRITFEDGSAGLPATVEPQRSLTFQKLLGSEMASNCYSINEDLDLPPATLIRGNFVVRGRVKIGRDSQIEGSIKSYGDMSIGDNVGIQGSLISGGDLDIGPGCRIRGPAVASRHLNMRSACQIGTDGHLTSAIAPTISVDPGVLVFGTVWARNDGRVGGPNAS
jgi:hypothetical protein